LVMFAKIVPLFVFPLQPLFQLRIHCPALITHNACQVYVQEQLALFVTRDGLIIRTIMFVLQDMFVI